MIWHEYCCQDKMETNLRFTHEEQTIMSSHISRRVFISGVVMTPAMLASQMTAAQTSGWTWSLPIGTPGQVPGDGFYLRHGFATENTAFYPGGWHTGENYYVLEGDTAGAEVYAVADGDIVYAGFDYPGPVVIIQHADDLFSMYGHLDYELDVDSGPVQRGQRIGTVLDRKDGRSPSHVHFEIRRFLTTPEVNGPSPRYSFACGPDCPPGPGYWPIDAPEHPTGMGWLNPMHVIARQAFPDGVVEDAEIVVAGGARRTTELWSAPSDRPGAEVIGEMQLAAGDRFPLRAFDAGAEDSTGTSAEAYRLWYQIEVPDVAGPVWVQAIYPSMDAVGSDGRPSSVRFDFLPMIEPL